MEKWQRTMLADSMGLQKNERALFLNYASEARKGAKADTKMLLLKRLYDLTMNGQGDNHQPDIPPMASTKRIEDLEEELECVTRDYEDDSQQYQELRTEACNIDSQRKLLKDRNKELQRHIESHTKSYKSLTREKDLFQRLAQYSLNKRAYDQACDEFYREGRMPEQDASYLGLDKVIHLEKSLAYQRERSDEMKGEIEFYRTTMEILVNRDTELRESFNKARDAFRNTGKLPTRDDV